MNAATAGAFVSPRHITFSRFFLIFGTGLMIYSF